MNRRDFFTLTKKETLASAPSLVSAILSGLEVYSGPFEKAQVIHLLRRTMFGVKQEDLEYFMGKTMEEAVDELLQVSPFPDPPVNNYNDSEITDPIVPFGETWVGAEYVNEVEGRRVSSLKGWWIRNIVEQERTIQEKMNLFWHNHIPTQFWGIFQANWSYQYMQTLHTHSMGNFRDLIKSMTLDPGMLHYLNGQYNNKWAPDENYSRELQELFCIGKGSNAAFTEEDVQVAAKILTGWRVDYSDNSIYFDDNAHDTEDKVFSAFYNNATISGRTGQEGKEELDDLLDLLLDNEECALFLCRKLYRFFVADLIDDTVETNIIEPLATILRDNNYNIAPVLSALFRSQHFFDALTLAVQLKAPNDYLLGMMREMRMKLPAKDDLSNAHQIGNSLSYLGMVLQQELGDPPNVAGWPAYYQIPVYDKSWISTDSLPKRGGVVGWFLWSGMSTEDDSFVSIMNLVEVVENLKSPENPNLVIDELCEWLLGIQPTDTYKTYLKSALLSGQSDDSYWTEAWVDYVDTGTDMAYETVYSRLKSLFWALLQLEECHLS